MMHRGRPRPPPGPGLARAGAEKRGPAGAGGRRAAAPPSAAAAKLHEPPFYRAEDIGIICSGSKTRYWVQNLNSFTSSRGAYWQKEMKDCVSAEASKLSGSGTPKYSVGTTTAGASSS